MLEWGPLPGRSTPREEDFQVGGRARPVLNTSNTFETTNQAATDERNGLKRSSSGLAAPIQSRSPRLREGAGGETPDKVVPRPLCLAFHHLPNRPGSTTLPSLCPWAGDHKRGESSGGPTFGSGVYICLIASLPRLLGTGRLEGGWVFPSSCARVLCPAYAGGEQGGPSSQMTPCALDPISCGWGGSRQCAHTAFFAIFPLRKGKTTPIFCFSRIQSFY